VQIDGVFGHKAFEKGVERGVVVGYGRELWIELGNVRADTAMEDLLAVSALNSVLTATAGSEEQADKKQRPTKLQKCGRGALTPQG
jgi:hypothetical protein